MANMTRFEIARLISARALQVSLGAPPLVKVKKEDTAIEIAKKEFGKKILPLSVIRILPNKEEIRVEIN